MRVALHSVLREGAIDDYLREHARVPDELAALFGEAGIRDWTIWRSGLHLFHLVECDDWGRAMTVVDAGAANDRWQAHIGVFVDGFRGPDSSGYLPLQSVWRLTEQTASTGGDGARGAADVLDVLDVGID